MNETGLKQALREDRKPSRREARAARTRAKALSPVRILIQVLLLPLVTLSVTVSIYVRTSPYDRDGALRHLAALSGCDTAAAMGLAPAFEGGIGYHKRNDPDGDGIACEDAKQVVSIPDDPAYAAPVAPEQTAGGAKFLRP